MEVSQKWHKTNAFKIRTHELAKRSNKNPVKKDPAAGVVVKALRLHFPSRTPFNTNGVLFNFI
jgi:hypothetical protein